MANLEVPNVTRNVCFLSRMCAQYDENGKSRKDVKKAFPVLRKGHLDYSEMSSHSIAKVSKLSVFSWVKTSL